MNAKSSSFTLALSQYLRLPVASGKRNCPDESFEVGKKFDDSDRRSQLGSPGLYPPFPTS